MMLLNSLHAAFKDLTPLEAFLVLFVVCFCFVKDYLYIIHIVDVKHKHLALYHPFKGFLSASLITVTECVALNSVLCFTSDKVKNCFSSCGFPDCLLGEAVINGV